MRTMRRPTTWKTDDLKDSFYLRIIRTTIGGELRRHFGTPESLPDKLAELLEELDDGEDDALPGAPKEH